NHVYCSPPCKTRSERKRRKKRMIDRTLPKREMFWGELSEQEITVELLRATIKQMDSVKATCPCLVRGPLPPDLFMHPEVDERIGPRADGLNQIVPNVKFI